MTARPARHHRDWPGRWPRAPGRATCRPRRGRCRTSMAGRTPRRGAGRGGQVTLGLRGHRAQPVDGSRDGELRGAEPLDEVAASTPAGLFERLEHAVGRRIRGARARSSPRRGSRRRAGRAGSRPECARDGSGRPPARSAEPSGRSEEEDANAEHGQSEKASEKEATKSWRGRQLRLVIDKDRRVCEAIRI